MGTPASGKSICAFSPPLSGEEGGGLVAFGTLGSSTDAQARPHARIVTVMTISRQIRTECSSASATREQLSSRRWFPAGPGQVKIMRTSSLPGMRSCAGRTVSCRIV